MVDNIIAILGSLGTFIGVYTLYVKATGKNKVDIGAVVNTQIQVILKDKDGTIGRLETRLTETNKKNDDLEDKMNKLNDKFETLLMQRIEDKSTITRLTSELADEMRDKDYWKRLYEEMKEKYEDMKRRFKDEH